MQCQIKQQLSPFFSLHTTVMARLDLKLVDNILIDLIWLKFKPRLFNSVASMFDF